MFTFSLDFLRDLFYYRSILYIKGRNMRFLKCFLCLAIAVSLFSTTALAKGQKVSLTDSLENEISISLDSGYVYYTLDDIDKDSSYFSSLPIDKNEAREEIANGTYMQAFCESEGVQVVIKVTTDNFSQSIGNLTQMDEGETQAVMKSFKASLELQNHALLKEPEVTEIDGYKALDFLCRAGSGESGFSYRSLITIIGSRCYEFTFLSTTSIPDEMTKRSFDDMIDSINLSIKGETGEIVKSVFMSVLSILAIVVACAIGLVFAYSLVMEFINARKHSDKVRLKKRN